jgi:hypothetical protein
VRRVGLGLACGIVVISVLAAPIALGDEIDTKKACDSSGCYVISKRPHKAGDKSRQDDPASRSRRPTGPDAANQSVH